MERLDRFESEGFVFLESFQSKIEIEQILENLDRVIEDVVPKLPPEHVFYEDKSDRATMKQIQQLQRHDNFFGELMTKGPFRELAVELLGGPVVCQNMQYFNKPPTVGLPTPAHQDGFYFKLEPCEALTMWMALERVDEENGCVRYIPGSHRLGMRPHGPTGTLGFSQGIVDFPHEGERLAEVAFPALAGDLLAHHALTIHRADGNQSETRSRRALGFIYYGAAAKENREVYDRYQAELKQELSRSGKI